MTRTAKKAPKGPEEATKWEDLRGSVPSVPPRKRGVAETEHMAAKAKLRSEQRRLRRIKLKAANVRCFNCRQMGHVLEDCKEAPSSSSSSSSSSSASAINLTGGYCYRCGSTEHTSKTCSKAGFQFARCFVCGQPGHLSAACPQNARGAYPDGGECKKCGSKAHLAKDCKAHIIARGEITLTTGDALGQGSADTDDAIDALVVADKQSKKHKRTHKAVVDESDAPEPTPNPYAFAAAPTPAAPTVQKKKIVKF